MSSIGTKAPQSDETVDDWFDLLDEPPAAGTAQAPPADDPSKRVTPVSIAQPQPPAEESDLWDWEVAPGPTPPPTTDPLGTRAGSSTGVQSVDEVSFEDLDLGTEGTLEVTDDDTLEVEPVEDDTEFDPLATQATRPRGVPPPVPLREPAPAPSLRDVPDLGWMEPTPGLPGPPQDPPTHPGTAPLAASVSPRNPSNRAIKTTQAFAGADLENLQRSLAAVGIHPPEAPTPLPPAATPSGPEPPSLEELENVLSGSGNSPPLPAFPDLSAEALFGAPGRTASAPEITLESAPPEVSSEEFPPLEAEAPAPEAPAVEAAPEPLETPLETASEAPTRPAAAPPPGEAPSEAAVRTPESPTERPPPVRRRAVERVGGSAGVVPPPSPGRLPGGIPTPVVGTQLQVPAREPSRERSPVAAPEAVVDEAARQGSLADRRKELRERFDLGDYTGALVMAEAMLELHRKDPDAIYIADVCRSKLRAIYAGRLGSLTQIPTVIVPPSEMRWLSLDHRAGFVLSLIDGVSTLEEIIDVSTMPPLEVLRTLYNLLSQNVLELRAGRRSMGR
ncbi:MAG: hypothetical protein HY909_15035 [Deltaproteobacteria bacterium]|nr:hypothetical protein [Deltaproteobacteria bacterium]